jgi:hypothetical protein
MEITRLKNKSAKDGKFQKNRRPDGNGFSKGAGGYQRGNKKHFAGPWPQIYTKCQRALRNKEPRANAEEQAAEGNGNHAVEEQIGERREIPEEQAARWERVQQRGWWER